MEEVAQQKEPTVNVLGKDFPVSVFSDEIQFKISQFVLCQERREKLEKDIEQYRIHYQQEVSILETSMKAYADAVTEAAAKIAEVAEQVQAPE
jgi:hypothetical protein